MLLLYTYGCFRSDYDLCCDEGTKNSQMIANRLCRKYIFNFYEGHDLIEIEANIIDKSYLLN
jgi:hypothetical protein